MMTHDRTATASPDQAGPADASSVVDDAAPRPAVPRAHQEYSNCSRCGLSISVRFTGLRPEYCPRCLARARIAHPMFLSPLPFSQLTARPPVVERPHGPRWADGSRRRGA